MAHSINAPKQKYTLFSSYRYIATLTRVPATSFAAKRTRRRLAIHARDVTPNPPMEIPFAPTRFFMPRPGIHPPFIADEID
ncbi:hypothetical protein GW17_00023759 [Ensete ventricosum]|nr:hypothetical protein GW17_00023759 [Ensete ventricosum]